MSRGAHAAHANRNARSARSAGNTRTRRQPQQAWNVAAPNAGDGGRAGGYGTRATFAAPRLTFLNALRAELCKALSLKSTYVLLIINALLLEMTVRALASRANAQRFYRLSYIGRYLLAGVALTVGFAFLDPFAVFVVLISPKITYLVCALAGIGME